ncbi:unnamed protein product [Sphenostylis stenocarpa]|uniref:Uncharacterized protein n=1 Tax=Sphenostylis stenocarpa TaxID=92480 RepID=A0AA86SAM4_9FABA|nr:unnamed protein product [Sphenostylis stenocarpa]
MGDGERDFDKNGKSRTAKVARKQFRVVTRDALRIAYALQKSPTVGLEPTTTRLRALRSTN